MVRGISPKQSDKGEAGAVGDEAAAKSGEEPSAEAQEDLSLIHISEPTRPC